VNVRAQQALPGIGATELPVAGGGMFPVRRVDCVGRNYQ
jgi:fumarylpyruvate hydrolase